MKLVVNGEPRDCAAETVDALFRLEAAESGIESPQGVAIALNGRVLRRRDWGKPGSRRATASRSFAPCREVEHGSDPYAAASRRWG